MNKLTSLANKYSCDKGTEAFEKHGYTEEYDKIIPETGEYNLLEIGIWYGDSLKMWNDYNPELNIDAIDIDPSVFNHIQNSDKIHMYIGDQVDHVFLSNFIPLSKLYDFIIDDGSHRCEDILLSFEFLYDKLKPGGYYFIEDLHASQAYRDKTIIKILRFIANSNRSYKSMSLVCTDKLLIIKK